MRGIGPEQKQTNNDNQGAKSKKLWLHITKYEQFFDTRQLTAFKKALAQQITSTYVHNRHQQSSVVF